MAGYHNIVMPDQFSQGSVFAVGFDTRITQIESQQEERTARGNPWGRRKYTLLRGIVGPDDVTELRDFYILRGGALNSFKFKDWTDYATTASGTLHLEGDDIVTAFDQVLQQIVGNSYQMVRRYIDTTRTIVRPLEKLKIGTVKLAVNGVEVFGDFSIDEETGEIIFGASHDPISTVDGGCEFYTVTRFAQTTDEAFSIAAQSSLEALELPGFELIEELAARTVSQDYQYGGSITLLAQSVNFTLTEVKGRLWVVQPTGGDIEANLPLALDVPDGGPIFVIKNIDATNDVTVQIDPATILVTINPGVVVQIWMSTDSLGDKIWIAV